MTKQAPTKNERRAPRELSPKERRAVAGGADDSVISGTGNNQA